MSEFDARLQRAYQRFAEAVNRWANRANALSPDSPDFEARIKEQWESRGIEEKFDELRKVIRDDS